MKKLGKFEIIEKVGQGAMGVVYKARDPFIDRIVALKTLTTGLTDDPNLLKRFYSEARSAGGLQHPNIVTIYELGHEGDTPFIAMQFLTGESLDKIIDRRPNLPLSQKIGFIVYVCRALEYAHKQNPPVVHRDIKPGNVMVTTEGNVMVVDFGIARLGEGTRSQSAGMLIGTLGYMAPQLFRGGTADARSDIWATGVMFYELLAYQRPFGGDNAAALMSNIILEKPRSIIEAAPGTTQDIQAVVDRMLAKEAEARYQSMEEVLMELEPIWRSLQQAEVSKLLANSQQLFEAGDLENAKAKVSQIIQIDTSNTQAKSLLEKINAEVRRKQIVPQLKARVEKAERLLANGQVEDARAEVEAALKVDSTFQPARELLGQAEAAIARARDITQALHASKQRMAEGALTEAELQLDKVLALDPGNAAAREQLKQIREERSRRERRKQRDEALHRARILWTNLQYEECITLLLDAQKQFPADKEISKLLESARQDQTEQQRQSLLTEVRNLLSAQRFDDALRTLDRLLERYPSDATAKNLRAHALQGRDQQAREQRLVEEKSKLRSWVKEGRYLDAITHTGQLSREFPDDFELAELLDFARSEQSQLEQKARLQELTKQIHQALKDGRFSEAVQAAEKALLEFPKNPDLLNLLDRAKREQSEKEKHDLVKQRLREVERLMDRQELTDAIDLAHRTQVTIGRDSRISSLLEKAQKELEFREKKKKEQNDTVQKARTLIDAGKVADATSILKGALDTQLFPSNDPRIAQLLNEIDTRKEAPPATAAAAAGVDSASRAPLGSPISSRPTADPGKDYVYQRGAPLPEGLVTPERDTVASSFSPTIVTGPFPQPVPPPAPAVGPQVPEKTEKKQRRPDLPSTAEDFSVTRMISPASGSSEASSQLFAPETEIEQPAVERRKPRPAVTPISVEPLVAPALRPFWKNPIVVGAIVLAIAAGAGYAIFRPQPKPKPPERGAEWNQAEQLMSMTPRHLGEALAKYQAIIAAGKDSEGNAKQKVEEIQQEQKRENDWMEQGAKAQAAEHYDEALKDFGEARSVNGDREKDAEEAIKVVNDLISGKKPLEIAQENLTRADQFAEQKLWDQAVRAYKQVGGTTELTPDLRKRAADGLRNASAHLNEQTLWARAQSYQNTDPQEARNLADKVVKMNLDHRAEAQELISKIDLEFKASREDAEYNDLRQQVDAAKGANNVSVDALKNLQVKARNIATANGKHAAEARNIAESEIPNLLKTSASVTKIQQLSADGRGLSQSGRYREAFARANDINQLGGDSSALRNEILDRETRDLQALQNEYNSVDKKNGSELKALQGKVQQFITNANKPQDAQAFLSSIAKSIDATKTGPSETGSGSTPSSGGTPSGRVSTSDDEAAVRQVFSALSKVFDDRSAVELKSLWPQIPTSTLEAYRSGFEDKSLKSVSRKYEVASVTVMGDSATASGVWTGAGVRNGHPVLDAQGKWKATLQKVGGHWLITSLQ